MFPHKNLFFIKHVFEEDDYLDEPHDEQEQIKLFICTHHEAAPSKIRVVSTVLVFHNNRATSSFFPPYDNV